MVSVSLLIIYAFIKQYACGAQSCEQSLHMQPQMYGCPCLYIGEGAYAVGATWPCNAFKAGYMDCCCCWICSCCCWCKYSWCCNNMSSCCAKGCGKCGTPGPAYNPLTAGRCCWCCTITKLWVVGIGMYCGIGIDDTGCAMCCCWWCRCWCWCCWCWWCWCWGCCIEACALIWTTEGE